MNICLIIINYNGFKFLQDYLEGVVDMCGKNNVDLIITDDRSTDSSLNYLKSKNLEVTVNNGRKGFAANVNNGIKYAQKKKEYGYYIIANNDIEIREGLFENALPKALSQISKLDSSSVGLIGFEEILDDREDYFNSYNFNHYNQSSVKKNTKIPGFFFIITRRLIDAIGFMDEDYFMYGEDNDYFIRTIKAGFTIFDTGIPVRHYSEGTSSNSKITSWYVYRNAFLCAQKNNGLIGVTKTLLSFVYIIYNPFYRNKSPSNKRIRRNGFFYNNLMLVKSLFWNFKYYLNRFYGS